jgi:hypothetical protein
MFYLHGDVLGDECTHVLSVVLTGVDASSNPTPPPWCTGTYCMN